MGQMKMGKGRFWSDGSQDAIDDGLEEKYGVTRILIDKVDDGDSKAITKAWQIFEKAKKDEELWDDFCEAASDDDEDYNPKKKDFIYGLQSSLGISNLPGPIGMAMLPKKVKDKLWPVKKSDKKKKSKK
jgi:hypothetical protein